MAEKQIFDIAIVGGGPAGLSAALTGRIRNKTIVVFDPHDFSLKLQKAHLIDNYLGLPQISGQELLRQFSSHCLEHEPVVIREKVLNIFPGEPFTLLTPADTYEARSVILASGVVNTSLLAGERDFLGRGVSYCATCDGRMFSGRDVAIVAYMPEGEHEATFMSEICNKVYYLPQYSMADILLQPKIEMLKAKPLAIRGKEQVEVLSTEQGDIAVQGVFLLRQSDPVENILPGLELAADVIKVNRDLSTSIPGVFAAGDCTGKPWQIAKATGEGLVAVLSAISYLDMQGKK